MVGEGDGSLGLDGPGTRTGSGDLAGFGADFEVFWGGFGAVGAPDLLQAQGVLGSFVQMGLVRRVRRGFGGLALGFDFDGIC